MFQFPLPAAADLARARHGIKPHLDRPAASVVENSTAASTLAAFAKDPSVSLCVTALDSARLHRYIKAEQRSSRWGSTASPNAWARPFAPVTQRAMPIAPAGTS
jgi:hypothetical protein